MLLRQLRLQSPPAPAVTDDDDLAFDVDAAPYQLLVVLVHAGVDVHQLSGHVAVGSIHVVGRHRIGAGRGGIAGDRRLDQARDEALRLRQLEQVMLQGRIQDLERLDLGVPTPLAELLANPLRIGLVMR